MSLTDGLALRLEAAALVRYQRDADCFVERELPPTPVEAVAIATYGGGVPLGDLPYREVAVQIMVRGGSRRAGETQERAQKIHDALHGLGRVDLEDDDRTCVISCFAQQSAPQPLGQEPKTGHHLFTINLLCEVVRDTAATPLS